MKKIKTVVMLVILSSILTTFSCTKEGKQGIAGTNGINGTVGANGQDGLNGTNGQDGQDGVDGLGAKTFNFNLTFNAGDTYKSYSGITGYDADDVVLFFMYFETFGSQNYWVSMPVVLGNVNLIPEFSDQTGLAFVNTYKSDGTAGSPWTSTNTFSFKAVLIKSSQYIANPNIDYSNYYEVKGAFNLKD